MSTLSRKNSSKSKWYFWEMIFYEIHSESECSKDEDIQASIITSLIGRFNRIEKKRDGIGFFRAICKGWF